MLLPPMPAPVTKDPTSKRVILLILLVLTRVRLRRCTIGVGSWTISTKCHEDITASPDSYS